MNHLKKYIPLIIICILHLVGLCGFFIDHTTFQSLSPLNLIFSSLLVIFMSTYKRTDFYISIIAVSIIGFLIEVIGVNTGYVFGRYYYGQSFGYHLFSVPLLIGLNWGVLLYSTLQLSNFNNPLIKSFFGAFLMVLLDFFIEQNAPLYDFWYWNDGFIPLQNYIAWFLISLVLNLIFQKKLTQSSNFTAKAFYIVQFLFFFVLYLFS